MKEYPALPLHPLCTLFPAMDPETFAAFLQDVADNGVREKIVTLDGQVLDGRNRQAAMAELGLDPEGHYEEFDGEDALAFVLSKNLARRHLSTSQRAMIAAKLASWSKGQNQHTATSANLPIWKAAKTMAVSQRAIAMARRVRELGNAEIIAAVEGGRMAISRADALVSMPRGKQSSEARAHSSVKALGALRLHHCADVTELSWADLTALRSELASDLQKVDALLAVCIVDDATRRVSEVISRSRLEVILGGGVDG